jgi:exopolysaccharide biosynthesis polyprenyl glycosylphosphotransferase
MIRSAERVHLMDTTLLLFRNMGLSADQQVLKRLFDVVMSIVGIIVASPFMLVIALCIKLYDGGPVFFTQDRLTEGGKVFKVYKFRSMRVADESAEYIMTRKNDSRVTPVGKVIRNIHFDELPQLFNILKGDMSIVGPRPECPQLAEEYQEIIPQFHYRLKVKAGLTGYAQVYGKYNTTPYEKLKMDLHYIENYSFFLDLKLIILTVKILFQKENTEGIEDCQKSAADPAVQK